MQSVPIITKVVSSNPVHGDVYSLQNYVIKRDSDLRNVGGFLRVLRFPPLIKLTATIFESGAKNHKPNRIFFSNLIEILVVIVFVSTFKTCYSRELP